MNQKDQGGEGNRQADRHYRKGVRRTVEDTSESEREEEERDLSDEELREARQAEEEGRSHRKG